MKLLIKRIIILVALLFLVAFLSNLFKSYATLFSQLYISGLIFYILPKMTGYMSRVNDKKEEKKLSKGRKRNTSVTLYTWSSDSSIDDFYLFKLLRYPGNNDALKNMNKIREKIIDECGTELNNYHLLKSYLEIHEKNNLLDKISVHMVSFIITIITAVSISILNSKKISAAIMNYIVGESEQTILQSLELLLSIGNVVMLVASIVVFILQESSKEKRRIELIRSIVDTIIEEKKNTD